MVAGRARLGIVLVGALLVSGCAPTDSVESLPADVTVELMQLRSDVAGRTAQVRVHNDSDEDLQVTSVVVEDPRFDGPALRDKDSLITAGRTVDLRFQLPAVECAPGAGMPTVTIDYELDGTTRTAQADLVDTLGFVPRLHDRECLRERVADVVALEWTSFEPSPSGAPAMLTLGLTPTGADGTASLDSIRTTNLLKFTVDGDNDLELGADVAGTDDPSSVEVPLVPWRCDPHAVQEDKRGTVFTVDVSVDGKSGPIEVAASQDLRGDILTWVAKWCGFAEGG